MEENTFERLEKDPPTEKCVCIERGDGTVSCPSLTLLEKDPHITLEDLKNICVEDMKKIMSKTEDKLIKKMENHATSKSKTTKKIIAKNHQKTK